DIREEVYEKAIIFLIGNKIDKKEDRKIQTEQGAKLAEAIPLTFLSCISFSASAMFAQRYSTATSLVASISRMYLRLTSQLASSTTAIGVSFRTPLR
ncbi:MAG: hypothetical protein II637_02125, partial [Bacteroidales bacterium]|nr:hypothetical protein [Bacteroidales bacterium]